MRISRRRAGSSCIRLLLLAGLSLALASCQNPIRVSTDRDPSLDFSRFETFAWISAEPLIPQTQGVTEGPPISPIDDRRIRVAVGVELAAKGWRELEDPDEADLIVSYGVGAEERTEIVETPGVGGSWHSAGYRRGGWYSSSTIRTRQVTEGTLTLEFFDRQTRQAAWVGWASKQLSRSSAENREETISLAIQKILETFPAR